MLGIMAKTAMKAAPKKAALRRPAAAKKGPPKNPRGGREALTVAQLVAFYTLSLQIPCFYEMAGFTLT